MNAGMTCIAERVGQGSSALVNYVCTYTGGSELLALAWPGLLLVGVYGLGLLLGRSV